MKYLFGISMIIAFLVSSCGTSKDQIAVDTLRSTTTIILVRHAEKMEDGTSDPGLTPLGKARAQKLAAMLAPTGIDAVYSTPYRRTRLTGQPTAELENLNIIEYDPRDRDFIQKLLERHEGATVLVVGHSNTIPMLVNALTDNTNYEQLEEMEYDKLFLVNVISGGGKAMVLSF